MLKKLIFIFLLIVPFVYSLNVDIQATIEGSTIDVINKQDVNVEIVESSSLRIGNPREESVGIYKISVLSIKETSVVLKYKKRENLSVSVGDSRKIDFDDDHVFDVSIHLVNLRPGRATLMFKSLDNGIEPLEVNETKINETTQVITENKIEETKEDVHELDVREDFDNGGGKTNLPFKIIIIFVLGSFLIFLFVLLIYKKRKIWFT